MDLNKAMVDMYKQRAKSTQNNKQKSLPPKRSGAGGDTTLEADQSDDSNSDTAISKSKRLKLEEIIASLDFKPKATFDQLHGCDAAREQILRIVDRFCRSLAGQSNRSNWPVLVCGSRGLGKTSIVEAAANHAKLKLVPIPLKCLIEKSRNEFKVVVKQLVRYCVANQPAIVLIDDLDQLKDKEELRYIIRGAVRRLLDGNSENNILVFCTTSSVLDDTSGIDFLLTIQLKRPSTEARYSIMKALAESNKNLSLITKECLESLAVTTPSFTASDLMKMFDIAETESCSLPTMEHCDKAVELVRQSFRRGTHLIGEKPTVTWNDVGGLPEVRRAFADILKQIRRGDINCKFAGLCLYGPPGCGKTMVAQAMANQAGLNFISIKPAELVDKFLGETERNIRRVFSEAQEHEPCMIYFDEFDGLCGTRGNRDNITSAIQTLLSEMDGFAGRGKSIILASTNRLEDIDPAMKRPGRLSKHIYVGPPTEASRRDILRVITSRAYLTLSDDIDLDDWAKRTDNFTGAELDFLVSEAESKAISEDDTDPCEAFATQSKSVALRNSHLLYAMDKIAFTNKELRKKLGHS